MIVHSVTIEHGTLPYCVQICYRVQNIMWVGSVLAYCLRVNAISTAVEDFKSARSFVIFIVILKSAFWIEAHSFNTVLRYCTCHWITENVILLGLHKEQRIS